MYRRQMFNIAQNRVKYTGISTYIDMSYVNKVLFNRGVVASFVDEILGHLILPFLMSEYWIVTADRQKFNAMV